MEGSSPMDSIPGRYSDIRDDESLLCQISATVCSFVTYALLHIPLHEQDSLVFARNLGWYVFGFLISQVGGFALCCALCYSGKLAYLRYRAYMPERPDGVEGAVAVVKEEDGSEDEQEWIKV
jgi:hypothetical protein